MIAELPREWQMEIALVLGKFIVTYDNTLTKSGDELQAERDRELAAFQQRFHSWDPQRPPRHIDRSRKAATLMPFIPRTGRRSGAYEGVEKPD